MSDLLIPTDFEVNIPSSPVALGQWLIKNGLSREIVNILQENDIDGPNFRSLSDRDLKDILPVFMHRKKIREWAQSLMSGDMIIAEAEEDNYSSTPTKSPPEAALTENEASISSTPVSSPLDETHCSDSRKRCSPTSMPTPPMRLVQKKKRGLSQVENTSQHATSLEASSVAISEGDGDILSLAQKLNLVVPSSVKECRRKKEPLSSRARNDVIKSSLIILQAAIGRDKPSQSEFELCAQQIILVVPEMKDPMPPIRQDAFKQWNTTLMQLKKAYYNRKPVERPRKNKTMMVTGENESTEEGHASQLIKEMKKKTPDVKTIHSLLTVSFNHRRKWITKLQGKGTVKRILEEYPGFRSFPQLMIETSLITKSTQYQKAWVECLPKLWEFVVHHCSDILQEQTNMEELDGLDNDERTAIVLLALPRAWGIKENFMDLVRDDVNFETYIKKNLNADCHLVSADSDGDDDQLFIVIDNEIILETDSYMKALFSFFGAHHVFNLEFPQKLKLCFKFLEEYIFGVPQKKKTVSYRNGLEKLLS